MMADPPAADTAETNKMQEQIAEKDPQISQLLDAQEAIAAKYRMLLAETESDAARIEAQDRMLKEGDDRIQALTAEKQQSTAALTEAQTAIDQLRLQVEQMKAATVEVHGQNTQGE
jgi:chromosome segregation ATPase